MATLTAAASSSSSSQPAAKTTLKIKPKPKNTATTAKAAAAAAATEPEVASSAPIEQIEKKIQKRTKKAKIPEEKESEGAVVVGAAVASSGKPKRQTKKKTDL
jgi:hypothetical protein